jgi:hypothetical protein
VRLSIACVCGQQIQRDTVKIGSDEGARLIARSRSNDREEGFLGQIFRSLGAVQPAPKEAEERFAIAGEKLVEGLGGAALKLQH